MANEDLNIEAAIADEDKPEEPAYEQSDKEKDVVRTVVGFFWQAMFEKDRTYVYLDGRTPIEYINDSVRRFTTNVDEREDIEDWQSRTHQPFTRNKLLAILGRVIDMLPVAEIVGRGDTNALKGDVVNTLYEYSEDVDDSDEFFVMAIQDALTKGTFVGYEGVETTERKRRIVEHFKNEDEFTVREQTIKTRKLKSYLVPLEEFYPSSMGTRKIQDMPFCFWRKEMRYETFCKEYSGYAKYEYVEGFSSATRAEAVDRPFFVDWTTPNIGEGNVEVMKYYNQDTDEFVIIANGIWLNPMTGDIVSPLPFNHKKLPFFSFSYDTFGSDFFIGKSFPDRIGVLQDSINVLNNMLFDQTLLTTFAPILVAGVDDIEDDFLRPGRRITIDTQGLPINQAYQKLEMGTPGGWHQFILNYTKGVLEESSIDQVSQGAAGVGGRTTATEIRSAAAGVVSLLGLFGRFVKFGVRDRANLRVPNLLQVYLDPSSSVTDHILTPEQKKSGVINSFTVDSSALTPGKRGTKIVDVYQNPNQMPTKKQIDAQALVDTAFSGKDVVRHAITPEYLDNFLFDVKIIPNPKSEMTRDVDRALEIQFQQTLVGIYGPFGILNMTELATELVEKFGKDPSKIIAKPQAQGAPQQPGQPPNSMMPGPGGDNSASTVKGATGVGGEGVDMRAMVGQ